MRRSIITIALTVLALLGGGVVLDTATAQPAQASTFTAIFNDTQGPLWVTVGHHYYLIGNTRGDDTSVSIGDNATAFYVPDNICGYYTVNYDRVDNLTGGWHKVSGFIHVIQLRCPNGEWTEQF